MSSGGFNWSRWKKKKPASSPSPPPDGPCEKKNKPDGAGCSSEAGKVLSSSSTSSASTSCASTSRKEEMPGADAGAVRSSSKEKPWRDSSSVKKRKKSKHKEPSSQMTGNQMSGERNQTVSRRTKQLGGVDNVKQKDTNRDSNNDQEGASTSSSSRWSARASASALASTSKMPTSSGRCGSPSSSSERSGASTTDPTLDNSGPKKKIPEIPGYFYDEVKKRFFRVLPGHSNIPGAVTTESIRQREADSRRQMLLDGRARSNPRENIASSRGKKSSRSQSFIQLHQHRQRGEALNRFKRLVQENALTDIPVKPSHQVTPFPDRYFDGESGYISHLELDSTQKHVLMVISDDYLSRLWHGEIVNVWNPKTAKEETTISNWSTVNILTTRNCKVTHTNWAQVKDGENMYALYAISGGTTSSVQLFKCPSAEDGVSHISYRYESNHEMAWTCAWSNSPTLPAHLAIGSTRKAIVVDTLSARKQKLHTCHSDVFSQAFSRKSPVLYNGTRRGEILGIDLRIPSHSHVDMTAVLRHSVSVCSIKLLQDENYMLAGDMGGGIKLWDVRKCAAVQEFKGHHNESHHLPVKVDTTESVVYAVGQDKFTRVWSLRSGELLRTIPCPSSCHEDNAPVAIYSQKLACLSQPGLFMGQERQLYWYPVR